jgi:hypothetical protein
MALNCTSFLQRRNKSKVFFKARGFHGNATCRTSSCINQENEGCEMVLWKKNPTFLGVGMSIEHNNV